METLQVEKETLKDISENAFLLSGLNELNRLLNAHSNELDRERLDKANYFIQRALNKLSKAIEGSIDSIL